MRRLLLKTNTMSHDIYIEDGKASMMYVGEVPWHGLGKRVDKAATAAEAIKAANLDWKVTMLPLYGSNGILGVRVKDKFVIVREDKIGKQDCPTFGIVSKNYIPLQNSEAFDFFDTIVKDKKAAIYHTAGALGNGERIWILAKLPGKIRVVGDDVTNKYLLLSNNHDAQGSVQIKFTPVRVVCQNTLSMALSTGDSLRIPHNRNLFEQISNASKLLGIIDQEYRSIEETFHAMAAVKIDKTKLDSYLKKIFPDPTDKKAEKEIKKAQENRLFAEVLFEQGKGNKKPGVAGTLWAAYNGVTELVDHRVSVISHQRASISPSRRLNSIWFGEGASIKVRAYQVAVEQMKKSLN